MWAVKAEGRRRKTYLWVGVVRSWMDSWGKWQRKRPEVENMVGDGGRAWKLLWPESRALWETLTTGSC